VRVVAERRAGLTGPAGELTADGVALWLSPLDDDEQEQAAVGTEKKCTSHDWPPAVARTVPRIERGLGGATTPRPSS
jgi:hypothetical protein